MSDTTKDTSKKTPKKAATAGKVTTRTATVTSTTKRRATTKPSPTATSTVTYDEIAMRARMLFEQSGHQAGRDEEFWLEAERQLRGELTNQSR